MTSEATGGFRALAGTLRAGLSEQGLALLDRIASLEPKRKGARGFEDLGRPILAVFDEMSKLEPVSQRRDVARALIATLATSTMGRVRNSIVTPRVIERAEAWNVFLLEYLSKRAAKDYYWPNDYFVKDYRYVMGLTVPCGAQVVDLDDGVGPKTAFKLALHGPLRALAHWRGRWFRPHTDTRYLKLFNEAGWREYYVEVADLIKLHPNIRGIASTSWFFDPQLATVSPDLRYIHDIPMQHGGQIVRHGTSDFDIKSATAWSPTRHAQYKAGTYLPTCYSVLWERRELLAWAEMQSQIGGHEEALVPNTGISAIV